MPAIRLREFFTLSPVAKMERARDLRGEVTGDGGMRRAIQAAVSWLCRAQDLTPSKDGGVAHSYSLQKRCWLPSYPETQDTSSPHCSSVLIFSKALPS